MSPGFRRALRRPIRRPLLVGAVAIGLATVVTGCGVQPTGLNYAQESPFDFTSSSSAQSLSPPKGTFSVQLFLFPRLNQGPGSMVARLVDVDPKPMDLPALIAKDSPYAQDEQYTSYVPAGITLKETNNKHEYLLSSPSPVSPLAVQQLTCTFDQYWLSNPDPNRTVGPATRFIGPGLDSGWQDCTDWIVPVSPESGPVAKPTFPGAATSTASG